MQSMLNPLLLGCVPYGMQGMVTPIAWNPEDLSRSKCCVNLRNTKKLVFLIRYMSMTSSRACNLQYTWLSCTIMQWYQQLGHLFVPSTIIQRIFEARQQQQNREKEKQNLFQILFGKYNFVVWKKNNYCFPL